MARKRRKPKPQQKKTVAFVGMAKTSRHLAPWKDKSKEIWVLNESPVHNYQKRFNRLFQLHPRWDAMRGDYTNFNDPMHDKWLRNDPWDEKDIKYLEQTSTYKDVYYGPEGTKLPIEVGAPRRTEDFPIYVLDAKDFRDVPGAVTFPLHEILDWFAAEYEINRFKEGHFVFEYFTSTVNMMFALAMYEGFERIELFGFEMSSQEEYAYQKPATEFWMGVALGRGVEIYLPKGCALLGASEKIYGYEKTPGFTQMHAEIRLNELRVHRERSTANLNAIHGQKANLMAAYQEAEKIGDEERAKNLRQSIIKVTEKEIQQIAKVNSLHGGVYEVDRIRKELMAQKSEDKIGVTILPDSLRGVE